MFECLCVTCECRFLFLRPLYIFFFSGPRVRRSMMYICRCVRNRTISCGRAGRASACACHRGGWPQRTCMRRSRDLSITCIPRSLINTGFRPYLPALRQTTPTPAHYRRRPRSCRRSALAVPRRPSSPRASCRMPSCSKRSRS